MSILYESNDSFTTNNSDEDENNQSLYSNNSIELSIFLILNEIIKKNKNSSQYKKIVIIQKKQIFSLNKIPKINLLQYLHRIVQYCEIERSTLISALIYLDRFIQNTNIYLTEFNIHQILMISIIISYKMNEDIIYTNNFLCEVAGINLKIFNQLQIEFFKLINYNLCISEKEFTKYKKLLENYCYKTNCK
jgi:hypothetical protein